MKNHRINQTFNAARLGLLAAALLLLMGGHSVLGADAPFISDGLDSDGGLKLMMNKSVILKSKTAFKLVNVSQPDIADVNMLKDSATRLLVTAKKPGSTQLILTDDKEGTQQIDITVSADLKALETELGTMFPTSKIEVSSANGSVVLKGKVPNLQAAEQAAALAAPYGAKVMNFLEIGGGQQVMLQVRFAEVARGAKNSLGMSASLSDGVFSGGSQMGPTITSDGAPTSAVTVYGRGRVGSTAITVFLDAMRQNNLLRMLAEPTLVATSGQEASFLAGGEVPIPVPQAGTGGGTTITIEYKEFGVKLKFVPVVLGDGRIRLKVSPEVSELDYSTAVTTNSFVVPGVTKRKVETVIELEEGQSFALAGLLNNTVNASRSAVPILGDIPVLGELFRSTRYERKETELVVLVTPRLVEAMNPGQVPALPGERWRMPNEAELLLRRDLGGPAVPEQANSATVHPAPTLKGEYGFSSVEPAPVPASEAPVVKPTTNKAR